eukprot:m.132885 g.132885  ORF g.132885 m.132885 type:complete len:61 (+) comp29638_c1_seq1:1667-1849(+)
MATNLKPLPFLPFDDGYLCNCATNAICCDVVRAHVLFIESDRIMHERGFAAMRNVRKIKH